LLHNPFCRKVLRHIVVQNLATFVLDDEEDGMRRPASDEIALSFSVERTQGAKGDRHEKA
jgi:hypothetical protein